MAGKRVPDFRSLKSVIIPAGVEKIGDHWFYGYDFEEVTIPASVTEVETEAFCKCTNLKKVVF